MSNKNRKNKVIRALLTAGAATQAFPVASSAAVSSTEVAADIERTADAIRNLEANKERMLNVDENEAKKSVNIPGFVMSELTDKKVAEEKGILTAGKYEEILSAVHEMSNLAKQADGVVDDAINAWMKPTRKWLIFKNYHEKENITIQKAGYENNMTYIENLGIKQKTLAQMMKELPTVSKIVSPSHPCHGVIRRSSTSIQGLEQILSSMINNKSSNISKTEGISNQKDQASAWLDLNNKIKKDLSSIRMVLDTCSKDLDGSLGKIVDDCHNLGTIYSQSLQSTIQETQKSLSDKWEKEHADLIEKQRRSQEELVRIQQQMKKKEELVQTTDDPAEKARLEAEIRAEQQRVRNEYENTRTKLLTDLQNKLDSLKQSLDNAASQTDSPDYDITNEALKEVQPLVDELDQMTSEKLTEIEGLSEYNEYNAKALEEMLIFKQTQASKVGEINRQLSKQKAKFKTFKKKMGLKQKELVEKTKQCDYKIEEFLFNVKASLGAPTYDEFMKRQSSTVDEIKNQIAATRKNIESVEITLTNPNLEQHFQTIDENDIVRLNEKVAERVKTMTGVAIGINTQVLLRDVQTLKDSVEEKIRRMEAYKPDSLPDGFTEIATGLWNAHQDSNKVMREILNETAKALKQSKQETLTENINAAAVAKAKGLSNDYFDLTKEVEDKFIAMINTYKSRKAQMDAWDLVFKNNNVAQTAINRLNALRSERKLPTPQAGEISATERELVRENTEAVLRGSHEIADVLLDGLLSDNGHPVDALIVSGKSGSGKTETVKTVAAQLNLDINTITKNDIDRGGIQLANQFLQRAKDGKPVLILWDEAATGVIADTKNPMSGNVSDTMNEHINFIDRLREQPDARIVYVMTTNAREDYMHPPINGRCKKTITLDASGKSAMEAINGILDGVPTADWIETAEERSKKVQDAYSLKMRTNSSSMLGLRGLKQAVINAQQKAFERLLKAWEKRRAENVDLASGAENAPAAPAAELDAAGNPVAKPISKDFPFDDIRERVILYSKKEEKPCLQLTYVTSDEIIQEMNKQ